MICSSCSRGFSCPLTSFLEERMSICALTVWLESRRTINSWHCRTVFIIYLNWSENLLKASSILIDPAVKILTLLNIHAALVNFFPHVLGPIPASFSVFTVFRFLQIVITSIKPHNTGLQARKTLSWPRRGCIWPLEWHQNHTESGESRS